MNTPMELGDFCRYLLDFEKGQHSDPVRLGNIYREFYGIQSTLSLTKTVSMIRSLGIKIEAADYLNTGGTNMRANSDWHIHYSAKDRPATQKFTIFHELFEVIHKNMAILDCGCPQLKEPQLSQAADRFAAAVLIPPKFFLSKVNSTGYDLVKLGEDLELSHQCLLIALGQHLDEIPFVGALYEYRRNGVVNTKDAKVALVGDYLATVVVKTPQTRRVRLLCGLQTVPARNGHPQVGSLVCAAITAGRPMLWQNTLSDDMPVILVRPLLSAGHEPYRVILVAMPGSEFGVISRQTDKINPVLVDGDGWCPAQKKCRVLQDCIWKSTGG